jgi:hypothetical protein
MIMGKIIFANNDGTRCIFVDAMYDSGTHNAVDA